MLQTDYQKFSNKGQINNISNLPYEEPVKSVENIQSLRGFATRSGFNGVVWVHLEPCEGCSGNKIEGYFYNTNFNKLIHLTTINVGRFNDSVLQNVSSIRELLKAPLSAIKKDFEELMGNSSLYAQIHRVRVEGTASAFAIKSAENALSELPFLAQRPILSNVYSDRVEFEILTTRSSSEIASRLTSLNKEGVRFQLVAR